MKGNRLLRLTRVVILLSCVPGAIVALAQVVPPPPPPQPLGPPPVPPGNPVTTAKVLLGKTLFWDEQLSSTRTVACGSCHQASRGGTDPRSLLGVARSLNPGPDQVLGTADDVVGSPGVPLQDAGGTYDWSDLFGMREQVTGRLANSHINAAYAPLLFWDGRASNTFVDPVSGATVLVNGGALESQAAGPPVSNAEMGHTGRDWTQVAARVVASKPLALSVTLTSDLAAWINGRTYPQLFSEAFGTPAVTPARIIMAIATYERTLFSNQTPFDSALAGQAALTPPEAAGQQLFGALPCARCHAGGLMSDNLFHYIGVRPAAEDSGRAGVTGNPVDLGAVRTPSLRNVALRGSLMHSGRFHSLEEVVDFYDRGGDFNAPNKSPLITPLNLTPLQKAQLLAFLRRPITDPRVANQTSPFDRPSLYMESSLVPQVLGGGVAGEGGAIPQVVAIEPPLLGVSDWTSGVYGARGGASAVLVIDADEPPAGGTIPSTASFARVVTTLHGAGAGQGYGSVDITIPDDSGLSGQVLYGRWYVDDPAAPGGVAASPSFRMQVFGAGGAGGPLAMQEPTRPRSLQLYASRPSPFASSTLIRYDLFSATPVRLVVYDVAGRVVRQLVHEPVQIPGSYYATWDGRDDSGRQLAGGMYFYRLEAGRSSQTSRTIKLD